MAELNSPILFRGLQNPTGANHCFLNAVIQALYHMTSFRQSVTKIEDHQHPSESQCILCSLQTVFLNYRFSDQASTHPLILRQALANLSSHKMLMNHMYDASEAFVTILRELHFSLTKSTTEECPSQCVVHQTFDLGIVKERICSCGEYAEPFLSSGFLYFCSAHEVLSLKTKHPQLNFARLLQKAQTSEVRKCVHESCPKMVGAVESLFVAPKVFSIGVTWKNAAADPLSEIKPFVELLAHDLDLNDIFGGSRLPDSQFVFCGMVCYYGKHYSAILSNKDKFLLCDDTLIADTVGSSLHDVVEKCIKGRLMPTILLFEQNCPRSPPPQRMARPDNPYDPLWLFNLVMNGQRALFLKLLNEIKDPEESNRIKDTVFNLIKEEVQRRKSLIEHDKNKNH